MENWFQYGHGERWLEHRRQVSLGEKHQKTKFLCGDAFEAAMEVIWEKCSHAYSPGGEWILSSMLQKS
jgi:hypothetical protein